MSIYRYAEFFIVYVLLIALLQIINIILSIQPTITNSLVVLIISIIAVFKKNKITGGVDVNKVYFFTFSSFIYFLCSLGISYYLDNKSVTVFEGSVILILPFASCFLLSKLKIL